MHLVHDAVLGVELQTDPRFERLHENPEHGVGGNGAAGAGPVPPPLDEHRTVFVAVRLDRVAEEAIRARRAADEAPEAEP
jgi:hypothetical protein